MCQCWSRRTPSVPLAPQNELRSSFITPSCAPGHNSGTRRSAGPRAPAPTSVAHGERDPLLSAAAVAVATDFAAGFK